MTTQRRLSLYLGMALALTLCAGSAICEEVQTQPADTGLTSAPGSYRITSEDGTVRFPFDIYRGDIRFECKINGHAVHMLIDDGFMWDQLLFWGSPKVDSFGFVYDGEIEFGSEDADADLVPARTASGITLNFPGVDFTDQTALITAYSSGNASMWSGSVGQVSCTFLKHFVVDINFDEMMITLIEPNKFEYAGKGVAVPWRPLGFGPWSIPATMKLADGREVSLDFMMDLGYNTQLQISQTGPNAITAPEGSNPISLGFNIQRVETRGMSGTIPVISIGGYDVKNVRVGFVDKGQSDHTFHEAMIGLGLLSRFNLVFDYTRQRLFVEPNRSFGDEFE